MSSQITTPQNDLRSLIQSDKFKEQIALALPKHLTPDRFVRVALTCFTRNPKLLECSRESLLRCLMDLSSMGLEADGRHAHLIPYGKDCTLICDYKGIIALVRRDPKVLDVQCFTIRANDTATWRDGVIQHSFPIGQDRGPTIATYTTITWKSGHRSTGEPFSKEDAEKARKSSRSGSSGPWKDHYDEMWKKSNIRRDSKMWSLSPEIRDALDKDGDKLEEIQTRNVTPSARAVPLDPFTRPAALPGAPKSATVHSDSVLDGLNANDFSQDEYLAAMIYLKISSAQDFGQISEGEHKLALERWEEIEGEILERRAA